MRRTYGSKKDTINVIERRDLFQNLNENRAAYDAFSIQNIKQTKRELSCVGSSNMLGVACSKVRKKKFVKRIVKEAETPCRENMSASCYLTPDRSLHVNKPLEPFDLLLMSSPVRPVEADERKVESVTSKVNVFDQLIPKKEGRTYIRRKPKKAKKFTYSSTDSSDSDKENLADSMNVTENTSDIRSHKLQVEHVVNITPKLIDDSINNIVNNLSLINKLKHNYCMNDSVNKSLRLNRHRVSKNLLSPLLQKSPLCSTPFKVKYRGESIFKFSPITATNKDCSPKPKSATLMEDNDNSNCSIILLSKCKIDSPNIQQNILNSGPKYDIEKEASNEMSHPEKKTDIEAETSCEVKETSKVVANDTNMISTIEISSLQTSELQPLLGFSKDVTNRVEAKNENNVISIPHADNNINKSDVIDTELGENYSYLEERSDINMNGFSVGGIEIAENHSCEDSLSNETDISGDDNEDNDDDNSLLQRTDEDENTLYDTCSSEQSSIQTSEEKKEPVVLLQRMSDSSFFKYYYKMNCEEESSNSNSTNYETGSFKDCNDSKISSNSTDLESDIEENVIENKTDNYEGEIESNNDGDDNSEKDTCISFVTTRRRNEVINNSIMSIFNDSNYSSSTDCDKTVLSNQEVEKIGNNSAIGNKDIPKSSEENAVQSVDVDEKIDSNKKFEYLDDSAVEQDTRISFVTTRNSYITDRKSSIRSKKSSVNTRNSRVTVQQSDLHRESVIQESDMSRLSCLDTKPGIVLQPGKRWERSLSIYRRMTMMTDYFDKSILEEESTSAKGRKYRQSVISTMEMQELNNSLHNESINSRRSTFVSKPSRSTIRIVKDPNSTRLSLCNSTLLEDLKGYWNEECDDTIIELSKLSITDQTHEVTVLDNFHDTSNRIATGKDYVLRRCNQTEPIPFDECYPDSQLKNCHKIGEGVYGEVYLWRARDGRARVLKIVPIAGNLKVNGESQKDFHEIISEIVIAMELSALRAPIAEIERHFDEGKDVETLNLHTIENATDVFNEVLAVRCVYGSYPSRLLDLWDLYDECKGSENDNPAILPVDQQYIVLELANAGQDLESYQFNNAEQAHALFLQVAYGLAVAEEALQFEHRDLHWGNVLIAPTEQKWATFVIRGRVFRVARAGVRGSVIDYSLSRVALRLAPGDSAALYNDLAHDDSLFDAVGDYQFQVYRLMRDKVGNDWKNFEPYTNILWLHYTVDKMITALRYKRTNTKIHKHYIDKLKGIKSRILDYGSAAQFVLTDNEL